MIWSLCPLGYAHELDLLELRFAEQDATVDVFVVCEAAWTYSGAPKGELLNVREKRWAPWRSKIRQVFVEGDAPDEQPFQWFGERERWQRENFQRRMLGKAVGDVEPDDVVVVSDLDEILRASTIELYAQEEDHLVHPELPMHRHFLNLRWQDRMGISIARLCRGQLLIDHAHDVEAVRRLPPAIEWRVPYWNVYSDGAFDLGIYGWHFSWMGGRKAIEQKFLQAAHPEEVAMLATSGRTIDEALEHGLDLQGEHRRLFWVPDAYLPEHARGDRFAHLRCTPDRATVGKDVQTYTPDYYWRG